MKHTLSVVVEDRPGALTRITTMFARRAFNIESLAVGPTERPGVSCITIRVDCAQLSLELCNADRKRRLRDVAVRSGAREISLIHNRKEVAQKISVDHR